MSDCTGGVRTVARGPSGMTRPGRKEDFPEGPLGAVGGGSFFLAWDSVLGSTEVDALLEANR